MKSFDLLKILKNTFLPFMAITGFSYFQGGTDINSFSYFLGLDEKDNVPVVEPSTLNIAPEPVIQDVSEPSVVSPPVSNPVPVVTEPAPLPPPPVPTKNPRKCQAWSEFRHVEMKTYYNHGDGWIGHYAYIRKQIYMGEARVDGDCNLTIYLKPQGGSIELGWRNVPKNYKIRYLCGNVYYTSKEGLEKYLRTIAKYKYKEIGS